MDIYVCMTIHVHVTIKSAFWSSPDDRFFVCPDQLHVHGLERTSFGFRLKATNICKIQLYTPNYFHVHCFMILINLLSTDYPQKEEAEKRNRNLMFTTYGNDQVAYGSPFAKSELKQKKY